MEPENRNESQHSFSSMDNYGVFTPYKDRQIYTLLISGQIEGHTALSEGVKVTKYEDIIPRLVDIEESPAVGGLLVLLNTVGGDVEAGLAIAEVIGGMKTPVVSVVIGGGHSIGVPLAVCADESFIVPSATMTVHPVRFNGLVIGSPQSFSFFLKMQKRITDFVIGHAKIQRSKFEELMMTCDDMATDTGTVLDGKAAEAVGLIDRVGTIADALTCLKGRMDASL